MALFGTVSSDIHFRNRIINGDMRIDQRNNGAAVTGVAGQYVFPVDRFKFYNAASSKLSGQRSTVAPSGFTNSILLTSLAATTPAAGDEYQLYHKIEGFNFADLGWGTASAQSVTLSFWVRSSLTGTFSGALNNNGGTRSYVFTYAIAAANTWEQKTITIDGDTSGTWATGNDVGVQVLWDLGSGSNFEAAADSWLSAFDSRTSGAVRLIGTSGATWQVTGVQLEAGAVATPFERRPFGAELALCQRYLPAYNRVGNDSFAPGQSFSSTAGSFFFVYPVTPRVNPTGIITSPVSGFYALVPNGTSARVVSSITFGVAGPVGASVSFSFDNTGGSAGQANFIYSNTLGGQLLFTGCEL